MRVSQSIVPTSKVATCIPAASTRPRGGRPSRPARTGPTRPFVPVLVCSIALFFPIVQGKAGERVASSGAAGELPQVVVEEDVAFSATRARSGLGREGLESVIDRTARHCGVEPALVRAVIAAESAFNPRAVSRAGAVGLMQVMPATAADYGVFSTTALFDPETNIETGTRHLKRLLGKYGNDYGRVIMAYNAGEGVVDRTNSSVTFSETLDYTEAVIRHYRRNGGVQPMERVLKKVRALRRISDARDARRSMGAYLDPSIGRSSRRGRAGVHHLDSSLYPDLADGYLDSALQSDLSGENLDDLSLGGL